MADVPFGVILSVGSGILFLALAAFVGTREPRPAANVAFAFFAGCFGFAAVTVYIARLLDPATASWLTGVASVFNALAAAGAVAIAVSFPEPLRATDRGAVAASVALTLGVTIVGIVASGPTMAGYGLPPGAPAESRPIYQAATGVLILLQATLFGLAFLFALRFRRAASPRLRSQYALMSAAHALFPAVGTGALLISFGPVGPIGAAALFLALLLVAAAWLANVPGGGGAARNVALIVLGAALVGELATVRSGDWEATTRTGIYGVTRAAEVLIVAYAILRHQMFGIDLRVKWTIRQSTIGAVFVAVFFVVTELAATFFSEAIGPYVGVLAAGTLVFALTPLQHFAGRVADAAMPNVPSTSGDRDRAYRLALDLALADGVVSRQEERTLARLAKELGLDPERALALREEAEHELNVRTQLVA